MFVIPLTTITFCYLRIFLKIAQKANYGRREVTFFTPRVSGGWNSFDIPSLLVCVLPLSWKNGQTYGPEIQDSVEGYLGQVQSQRSRSPGQETF